eukprot:scpid97716/ scgid4400/ WD repeat-containing protein 88; PQQ repeat and WD repeat-containing protein
MDQAAALGLGESRKVKEPVAYLNELRGHAGPVRDVRFCHKDEHVLTASDDATLQLWDRKSEFSISTFHHTQNQPVTACDLNNEQDRILSSSWDQTLRLWSLETGKEILSQSTCETRAYTGLGQLSVRLQCRSPCCG